MSDMLETRISDMLETRISNMSESSSGLLEALLVLLRLVRLVRLVRLRLILLRLVLLLLLWSLLRRWAKPKHRVLPWHLPFFDPTRLYPVVNRPSTDLGCNREVALRAPSLFHGSLRPGPSVGLNSIVAFWKGRAQRQVRSLAELVTQLLIASDGPRRLTWGANRSNVGGT